MSNENLSRIDLSLFAGHAPDSPEFRALVAAELERLGIELDLDVAVECVVVALEVNPAP